MGSGSELARHLAIARDAIASGRVVQAVSELIEVAGLRDELTPTQLVDLLERSCVYGPRLLVDFVWDQLGPFVYRGWALALALRCAREDVARDLMERGVRLLEDPPLPAQYRSIAAHESALSRFDLTEGSPNLFLDSSTRTVCSEPFEPFSGNEQLVGGSFATTASVAATCDAVGRLAGEGLFDDLAFADLLRAVVVRASELALSPDPAQPEAHDACIGLAARLLDLHTGRGMGGSSVALVVATMLRDRTGLPILALLCDNDPTVFYEALESYDWLSSDPALVRRVVPHLRPGTPAQNAHLAEVLARGGCLEELHTVASWPQALSPEGLERAIEAASAAGHAEVASWLLARRRQASADAGSDEAGEPSRDGLADLLL